jgi:FMN phosphatase YigB (HAD superfamily)
MCKEHVYMIVMNRLTVKIVLFDLGDTLEHEDPVTHEDTLLPGAIETLSSIKDMKDSNNQPVILGLASDFGLPRDPGNQNDIKEKQEKYYRIIKKLGIDSFFVPFNERVTLSIEVGIEKPKEEFFRAAVNKVSNGLSFDNVIFITENKEHVDAVCQFSPAAMNAIHFKGLGQHVEKLTDLIPKIEEFTMSHSDIQG